MSAIKIGIIGVGGFARNHIASALRCGEKGLCEIAAAVARLPHDPSYREAEQEEELRKLGVKIYRSHREMFDAERGRLELVTVPLGIALHASVSIEALRAGLHVLCEKPAAGEAADALRMAAAQRESGRILAIGYQHLLTSGVQELKAAALDGRYGRLLEARTIIRWPRDSAYYGRNEWAGHLAVDGKRIFDSPMQNAAAHFFQNMLYVAGPSPDETASPREVYAENYRANDIESADTQFARVLTDTGVTILFVASHALRENSEPYSEFTFERARIAWDTGRGARVAAGPAGGSTGGPSESVAEVHDLPFLDALRAIGEGSQPKSSIQNAFQHVACVEAAFASSGGVHEIPRELVRKMRRSEDPQGPVLTVVEGMEELLQGSFESGRTPAELGIAWGAPGREIRPASE